MHALIRDGSVPRTRAYLALGLAPATAYRQQRPKPARHGVRNASHRRLSEAQRAAILSALHSPRFRDQTPAHTYHTLLGEGIFLASVRTMHRLLKGAGEARERRPIRPAQTHAVPRLQATAANQVWTWDITKLALRERGAWLYLYVLIDLYSRYVIGWMIAGTENSALACRFVGTCAANHQIPPNTLTVHQDRGAPMTANNFINLLAELKIDCSHSRPRVSNDNAFSEAHFKTLKTQPDYPARFNDSTHARSWCGDFFDWHNDEHQHSGLNGHIPADVFYGRAQAITAIKQTALDDAYCRHPERFVNGAPKAKAPPEVVSINPLPASIISLPTPMRNAEIQSDAEPPNRSQTLVRIAPQTRWSHAPNEVAKLH
ncbi:putative transposase [Tahibacter aquaticus]|uniref:Putative transposase n=1 Tax=Tahibacter aquaticus TaxID=520092 RepID=A0A4R6YMC3_9GAMM|nr:IS3 family transposase [Tahibacter aquaticus]TDR38364.1 putative transposase [Tahibacter aquaticus]